jgi:hypothetical protein
MSFFHVLSGKRVVSQDVVQERFLHSSVLRHIDGFGWFTNFEGTEFTLKDRNRTINSISKLNTNTIVSFVVI